VYRENGVDRAVLVKLVLIPALFYTSGVFCLLNVRYVRYIVVGFLCMILYIIVNKVLQI
jgi:hypothetical protein